MNNYQDKFLYFGTTNIIMIYPKPGNVAIVIHGLIKKLHVDLTLTSIVKEVEKHPEPYSMLAISDVLNNYKIPNGAYPVNTKDLTQLPKPFIAYLLNNKFVLVSYIDEQKVILSNDEWKSHVLNRTEFDKMYSGTILIAEYDEISGEENYKVKKRKEIIEKVRIPLLFGALFIILTGNLVINTSYFHLINWHIVIAATLKTVGVVISILLLIQSIDSNNPFIVKLCNNGSFKCTAILSSKAAKITDELSWSEVGFFYFTGTWLVILSFGLNQGVVNFLFLLSLFSLPYTFFSIYYQWQVAKQWCIFCCLIQLILWCEFLNFLPYVNANGFNITSLSLKSLINVGSILLLPVIIWTFVKPLFYKVNQVTALKKQLGKFKYDLNYFNSLLSTKTKLLLPPETDVITLGNVEAENVITIVSNPRCSACASAHKVLHNWLHSKTNLKVQVVFLFNVKASKDNLEIEGHLLKLNALDPMLAQDALHYCYSENYKSFNDFKKRFPVNIDLDVSRFLEGQYAWCEYAGVSETPTLYLNGQKLPNHYQLEDIKYFI